jgi:hypothetical protein
MARTYVDVRSGSEQSERSMQELEFLRANFDDAEATVRAYDTKSQIVLASTALSFYPIFIVLRQLDTSPSAHLLIAIVFCLFVAVLLLFLRVLAPVSSKLRNEISEPDLFFLRDASNYDAVGYRDALTRIDLSTSYAEQVLKLHTIRQTKHNRFQIALLGLAIYLLAVLLYGISIIAATALSHWA